MVGVWFILLASSSTLHGKVPRLIIKKTSRLTQAVVVVVYFFMDRAWRSIYTCPTGMFSRTFYAQHFVTKNLHISPRFSPTMFYRDANSVSYYNSTLLYCSIIRLYPQNPVFEIVHDESVKIYLHMYKWENSAKPPIRRIVCD